MSKLTRSQLYRHLDGAIEILRPMVAGRDAIFIIIGLLFLKAANDNWPGGGTIRVDRCATTPTRKE